MNTSVRSSAASIWIGLGAFGSSGNGNVAQAGTDAYVFSNGDVGYTYWIEVITGNNADYNFTYTLNASCGTQMYVEVDSPLDGDNEYYVIDGGDSNQSFTEEWPVTDGASGECFVEDPHNGAGFYPLADFNYIAFSNCSINGSGVGDWSHATYTMLNQSSQVMASPGAISNGGLSYHVNWVRAS